MIKKVTKKIFSFMFIAVYISVYGLFPCLNQVQADNTKNTTLPYFPLENYYDINDINTDSDLINSNTKKAYWTSSDKSTADIAITYKYDRDNILYLASLCGAHGLSNDSDKGISKIGDGAEEAAKFGTVDFYAEGAFFLAGGLPKDENGHSYYEVNGVKYYPRYGSDGNYEYIKERDFYKQLNENTSINNDDSTLISGDHATIFAFARKLKEYLNNNTPEEIILSFDYWSWATGSYWLENTSEGWQKDMALMREVATLLKDYYKEGKVMWLTDGNSSNRVITRAGDTNKVDSSKTVPAGVLRLSSEWGGRFDDRLDTTRLRWTYYLYPDNVKDFLTEPVAANDTSRGATTFTGTTNGGTTYYNNPTSDNTYLNYLIKNYNQGNGPKITTATEWVSGSWLTWGDTNTANGRYATSTYVRQTAFASAYLFSKRMAFYQYAMLNPEMFLKVTDGYTNWDLDDPSSYANVTWPSIDDWMTTTEYSDDNKQWRETVATEDYSDKNKIYKAIKDEIGFDKVVIEDTLNDGLNYSSAEVAYYDENTNQWVTIPSSYVTIKQDPNNPKKITATIDDSNHNYIDKRLRLLIHTTCPDDFYKGNLEAKDTNNGLAKSSMVNVNEDGTETERTPVTYDSPTLLKYTVLDLTLKKQVTGNLAETNKEFEYTIKLYDLNNNPVTGTITVSDSTGETEKNITADGLEVKLKHGESIVIKNIPKGFKYTIEETNTDYTEYYKIEKTNETNQKIVKDTTAGLKAEATLNENQTVTFTNNKEETTITGVSTNTKPFIILIVLGLIGFVFIKFQKKFSYNLN